MRTLILVAGLALVFAGCAKDDAETADENVPAAGAAGKADCPNCDPAGAGAFEQAGLDARWYNAGDKWHVAFQFTNNGSASRTDFILPTQNDAWTRSDLFLFEYEALRATEDVFQNQWRPVIEISVRQVEVAEAGLGGAESFFGTQRVDTYQHKVHFRMNDLTDAIDVTYFGRDYPNGRTVAAPSKGALALGDSIFPVNVPRLLVGGADVVAPTLPQELANLADSLLPGWRDRTFKKYTFDNGDVVYWEKGYLWPFYVENSQGRGLLLNGQAQ